MGRQPFSGCCWFLTGPLAQQLYARFKRSLDKFPQILLRLLAAYWYDPDFGQYAQLFYGMLLGEILPDLRMSRPEDLEQALTFVRRNGFPDSAKRACDIFTGFFAGLTISIDSCSSRNKRWLDADITLVVPFRKKHTEKVTRTKPYSFDLDWADTCEFGAILVNPGDGYVYELNYDTIDYRVENRSVFVKLNAFCGTREREADAGFMDRTEKSMEAVIVDALSLDVRISWDGPTIEARQAIDAMIERGEILSGAPDDRPAERSV